MQPHIASALRTASTADLLDVLGEILEPSMNGPFDRELANDVNYEALMDELIPVIKAYRAAYPRLARVGERNAA